MRTRNARALSLGVLAIVALSATGCMERRCPIVSFAAKNDMGGFDAVVFIRGVT